MARLVIWDAIAPIMTSRNVHVNGFAPWVTISVLYSTTNQKNYVTMVTVPLFVAVKMIAGAFIAHKHHAPKFYIVNIQVPRVSLRKYVIKTTCFGEANCMAWSIDNLLFGNIFVTRFQQHFHDSQHIEAWRK